MNARGRAARGPVPAGSPRGQRLTPLLPNAPIAVMKNTLWSLAVLMLCGLGVNADAAAADSAVPGDAVLEASGARVGAITIRAGQIFDLDDPRENKALFRLANRLHLRTRRGAIRAQLLFRTGDRYQGRLLAETERNLRRLNYLREPRIRPIAWHDGVVDILVETHDVWTLQIGPSFGRSGGKNETSAEFQDNNLLGFGKTLIAGSSHNVDRNSTYFEWRDPTVLGSRWTDSVRWANNSDGRAWRAQVSYPFYALDVHYGGGVTLADSTSTDPRYRLGTEYDHYRHAAHAFDIYAGWSPGLQSGHALRFSAGWHSERDAFSAQFSGVPPVSATFAPLPADRDLVYPYLQAEWITDRFQTTRNQDLIGRTEDVQFGLAALVQAGLAAPALGADRHALVLSGQATYGWQLSDRQQFYAGTGSAGRVEQGRAVDLRSYAYASWYWRTSYRTLTHIRVDGSGGQALDLDHFFTLGGDTGLRGYPLRYQQGSTLTLLKIEERYFTDWSIWRLFDVGGALFFDAGRVSGGNPLGTPRLGWLRDVGMGLRLGNSRSSLGNIIHIDLATPLNGRNLSRLQFLVSTEATF